VPETRVGIPRLSRLETFATPIPDHPPSCEGFGNLLISSVAITEARKPTGEGSLEPESVKGANYQLGLLLTRMGKKG